MSKWAKKNLEKCRMYVRNYRALKFQAKGNGLTINEWEEIKKNYSYLCAYCNQKKILETDHIVPLTKGGRHDVDNIAPACRSCNASKKDFSLLLFLRRGLLEGVKNG